MEVVVAEDLVEVETGHWASLMTRPSAISMRWANRKLLNSTLHRLLSLGHRLRRQSAAGFRDAGPLEGLSQRATEPDEPGSERYTGVPACCSIFTWTIPGTRISPRRSYIGWTSGSHRRAMW